ncbi:unnamed protein product [Schistosoma turkestanicum]|nr:unnamed protein product [Schistosoma turkestanicum]
MSNIFERDFIFKSNHSLDTQITASIDRGDFHLSLLSLISFILWTIYVLFYNARVVGLIVSVIVRRFIKGCYISVGSISFSALGGKLMLRDLVCVSDDYSVRICYVIVVFNYWTRYYPEKKDALQKRCLYVYLYGVDVHVFNRTGVYKMLQDIFKPNYDESSELLNRSAGALGITKETSKLITSKRYSRHRPDIANDQEPCDSASNSGVLDMFWKHAHKLLPAVKFDFELANICAGNHLLPRACLVTCNRIYGSYCIGDASSRLDKYQHQIKSRFVNLMGSLIPVSKYSGQHAIEDPPKSWDKAFHVFHFGAGTIDYVQDEPGVGLCESEKSELTEDHVTAQNTWPKWELHMFVNRICQLNYGPWADRQRDIIWRFFFPPSYQVAKPSEPITVGQRRVAKKFVFELKSSTNINLDLYFMRREVLESLRLSGCPDSVVKLSIPWLVNQNGFVATLKVNLVKSTLLLDHLWRNLLITDQYIRLDLKMYYPREWNMQHLWDIGLDIRDAQLTVLFDYKHYFKGLIDDWNHSLHPDLLSFVPCTYKFHIKSNNLDLILLANDYNWISKFGENAYLGFHVKKLLLTFDLSFIDFLPVTIPINYNIECSSVSLRISLPETSTLYYLLQEVHNRMKFVNARGQIQKSSPFHSNIQEMTFHDKVSKTINVHWFDCGWAPRISLRIAYIYHPSPWVSEYWRFIPSEYRPNVLSYTGSYQTDRKSCASKWISASSNRHNIGSTSQSDLEELALSKLRPEGSYTQGPTENDILKSKCDIFTCFEPDTVDVHLHIPSAQLLFYGTVLRHFIHVKENYFGVNQVPVSFDREPLRPDESSSFTDDDLIRLKSHTKHNAAVNDNDFSKVDKLPEKRFIDAREFRPLSVRVSLEFHNIQAHLPMHGSSNESPCPIAFLDCIGFEMDKQWHETKLQLAFSPILICFYDQNKDFRSKSNSNVSSSRIQLVGLQLRGQGMFSHVNLPIRAESLEYAWLLELTVGQLTGQLSAPKLSCLIQCLKEFIFSAVDSENQLISSKAFELCQHGRPQQLCPFWYKICSDTLCPTDMQLKYRMLRLTIDGIDLSIVENRNCLSIQCDPIRMAHCNIHGATHCDGMFALIPDIRLIQLIAPIAPEVKDQSNLDSQVKSAKQLDDSVLWFEAGSFSLGPVHINLSRAPEKPNHLSWQLDFLKRHDFTTKRLSFLWSDNNDSISETFRNSSLSSRHTTKSFNVFSTRENKFMTKKSIPGYIAPDIMPNCGCYGQCSFFGQNESGQILFYELSTGNLRQRAIFPSRADYKPDLFVSSDNNKSSNINNNKTNSENQPVSTSNLFLVNQQIPTGKGFDWRAKSLGFGESLLLPNCLLHELHSPDDCQEKYNGLLLMREEIISALLETSIQKGMDWYLLHFCEEQHYPSDTDSTGSSDSYETYATFNDDNGSSSSSSSSRSNLQQLIDHDSDMDLLYVKNSNDFLFTCDNSAMHEMKQHFINRKKKPKHSWLELNSSEQTKHSSLSDVLVSTVNDSNIKEGTNEDKKLPENKQSSLHSTVKKRNEIKKSSYLPSNLSLNSLIELSTHSSTSSNSLSHGSLIHPMNDDSVNNDKTLMETTHIGSLLSSSSSSHCKSPPTPPPRKFITNQQQQQQQHYMKGKECKESHNIDISMHEKNATRQESKNFDENKKEEFDSAFENFVDLRTQLNRPISESGLLRPAYGRHLSSFKCVAGLTCPTSLRNRWHICKHIYPGDTYVHSVDNLLRVDKNTCSNSSLHQNVTVFDLLRQCQPKIAIAPRFHIRNTGFSSQCITIRPDSTASQSTIPPTNHSKVASKESNYNVDSQSAAVKSKAIVWLAGPINLFLTPLLTESLERYIKTLIPIVNTTSPSLIVDSMHYRCVKSVERQIKPLLSSTRNIMQKNQSNSVRNIKHTHSSRSEPGDKLSPNSAPVEERQSILHNLLGSRFIQDSTTNNVSHQNITSKPFRIRKISADYELMSNSQDTVKFKKTTSNTSKPLCVVTELSSSTNNNHHHSKHDDNSTLNNNKLSFNMPIISILSSKVAALSVERINITFLQLYAVEDLVHLNSLKSGLHDLTCVSLMTFCIDSFSFELMTSYKRESLTDKSNNTHIPDKVNSISTPDSNISNRPVVASSTVDSNHLIVKPPSNSNLQHNIKLQNDNISSSVHDVFQISSSLSDKLNFISHNNDTNNRQEGLNNSFPIRKQHKRQPSAPPVLHNSLHYYDTLTQSSEPVIMMEKSNKYHNAPLLNTLKVNDYFYQEKSSHIDGNKPMKQLINSSKVYSNTKSPSMEYISSLSGSKAAQKDDGVTSSVFVKPAVGDSNYIISNSLDSEHLGSELVCQITVQRIHGQLRRLTRHSQFSADVLLTAIPFESSKAFFRFISDPSNSNLSPTSETPCLSKYFEEQSFGWIMFECGLQSLAFSWVHCSGFSESVSAEPNARTTSTDQQPKYTFNESAPSGQHTSQQVQPDNFSTDKKNVNHVNGLSSKLVVNTVWLNFAAPKRLPNKRRIELIRSDWNLLSTAAPTIRAWIDPCNRLVDVCKQFRVNSERRLLSVISCLMTEVVNPKSDVLNAKNNTDDIDNINKRHSHPIGNKVQLVMPNDDLEGYALHRTESAHVLRFDPSCQLLIVLKRYLLIMNEFYGITRADELLAEILKDSVVPQNEFLRRGILSLTREWRFLVDSLAVSVSDLKALREFATPSIPLCTNYSVNIRQNDFDEPAFPNVIVRKPGSILNAHDCQIKDNDSSLQQTATGKPLTTTYPKTGNYLSPHSPAVTSRLLKMVVGSLSPKSPRLARVELTNIEDGLKPVVHVNSNDNIHHVIDKSISDNVQKSNLINDDMYDQTDEVYWDTTDQVTDCINDTNDPLIRNPIMKRFLQDARANIMEHPSTLKATPVVSQSSVNITDPNQHNVDTSIANRLSFVSGIDLPTSENDDFIPAVSNDDNFKTPFKKITKSTKEKHISIPSNFDHLCATDCKITAADFEQAAHMNAQYRYMAYIQSLFSPLLESVELSIKGIRRTTLMKKFDGFLSIDGLLKTFQIEIVSSARNPILNSPPKNSVSDQINDPQNSRPVNRSANQQTSFQRQSAFLCCNFGSNLILRDIVDYSGASCTSRKQKADSLSQMQTTTKIDVILHIDFIRQHVNLSLLRLVHQFITMVYCARDTCKYLSRDDQSANQIVISPTYVWSQKHDSKDSSDDADGTFRSLSSAYVRFGGSVDSGGSNNPSESSRNKNKGERFTNNEEPFASFTSEHDRSSGENTSNCSADKDLLIITNPANLHDVMPTVPSFPPVPTSRITQSENSSMNNAPRSPNSLGPSCWQRLANYVELYSTVPKTKTVIRKHVSASGPTSAMPTITEEDRDLNIVCTSESCNVKHHQSTHSCPPSSLLLNSPTGNKGILFGKKSYPSVTYRVLNEELDNDHELMESSNKQVHSRHSRSSFTNPWNPSIQAFLSRPSAVGSSDKFQNLFKTQTSNNNNNNNNNNSSKYHFIGLSSDKSAKKDQQLMTNTNHGLEQFTYPWVWGERIPLVVFVTAKIRQMAVSAVLSELNLNACVRNVHGSFTLTKQIRGHGSFSEKFLTHSSNLHYSDSNIQLTEKLPLKIQEVVCVQAGRSHIMLSCSRNLQSERNACVVSLGKIMVTLPHHPVRLHSVVQRQAKRISSTVYELLRNPNAGYTQIHSWRSSGSRMATTPTTCSTTTTASDPSNHLRPSHQSLPNESAQNLMTATASKTIPSPPLSFNLLAVFQGLTVNVALHSTLKAVYHIDPVYVTGQVGSRSYVDISITDHSLSLKSVRPPANFPTSISLPFPRILASIVQRVSSGGRYARSQRKEPMLTYGLAAEQGVYLDIQIQIDTLEQNLTADMLNYIMVVVKLFMKEINEVIQKMAGEERPRLRKPLSRFTPNQMSQPEDPTRPSTHYTPTGDWLLSRAARGRTKFTIKIRMKEIQLLASTKNGAIKLEARKIEIELTNRVSQTYLLNNQTMPTFYSSNNEPPSNLTHKRPTNLNIRSSHTSSYFSDNGRKSSSVGLNSCNNSLFIYATIANISLDLGHFDQDTFHALSPDFQNVAFFRTSIALRSLLADEKFEPNQSMESSTNRCHGEQDAFLISLNRPIIWLKPFTLDRGMFYLFFPIKLLLLSLPSQSLKSDSRTALVLTLNKSRISACHQDSVVSQGEFTDFCLRFDDEFNVGSDDWKPDRKRSTIDVKGKRHVVILNACVVPSGTFNVYWRDLEKRGRWHIAINWQMRGLDFHLDDNIGRRLKALFTILTRMTGYNDAAPLLPTSGEEEEEEGYEEHQSHDIINTQENQTILPSENEHQTLPCSNEKRSSLVSSVSTKNPTADVDIASLDRYRHTAISKEFDAKNTLDHSHFRSMEFHKHKLDLSDLQAFKRQKWNTLRKKKSGHVTRGLALRAHNSLHTDHYTTNEFNFPNVQPLGSQSIPTDRKPAKTCLRPSFSVTEDFVPNRTQGDDHTKAIQQSSNVQLRKFSNTPLSGISSKQITKMDSVYFDADDTSPNAVFFSKHISTTNNIMTNSINTKSDINDLQYNSRIFDEYSDDWCDPYGGSLDVDDDLYHDADELNTVESDNTDSSYTIQTMQTCVTNLDHIKSSTIRPPTPPPRQIHIVHDEPHVEFHPSTTEQVVDNKTTKSPNTQQVTEETEEEEEPKLQFELDLQIHVDSGCCVLHPRLPSKFLSDDNRGKHVPTSVFQTGIGINPFNISNTMKVQSPEVRSQTPGAFSPTHNESGYRLSYSDLLPGYLERYRHQLLQDFQIVPNDISIFYLPAVDVNLHYNSMTELEFLPGSSTYNVPVIPSEPPVNTRTLSPNAISSKSTSQSRAGQTTANKDDSIPRSIRKQADLYISCFLQKLPNELIVQPALLDFLEQAIENLPLTSDWNSEVDSVSSDSGNEILFEKFPVHAIVHFHVQPFTIRFLCLPTSRMQCLMVLPFLDAVFSTKRDDPDTVMHRTEYSVSRKLCDLNSLQSDNQSDNPNATLKQKPIVGDVVSAGGLSITAILKEFRISIFHPYSESTSIRSGTSSWGNARPCDSLTIFVKEIQCHLSRTVKSKVVQINPNATTSSLSSSSNVNESNPTNVVSSLLESNKIPSNSSIHHVGETMISTQSVDNYGLHRNLCISGIFDIGVAEFTCDTRRTLEILDIYNSWYRSSLARRLFLGNDELTETVNITTQSYDQDEMMDDTKKPQEQEQQQQEPYQNLETKQESLKQPLHSESLNLNPETQQSLDKSQKHSTAKTTFLNEVLSHKQSNVTRATTIGPCKSTNDKTDQEPKTLTISTSPDPTSKLTTLVGERGASGSRNTSLRVASWDALTIFCVHLKKFDLNLYMGSAMGLTRLIVDQSFCEGHISVNSSGRKNTLLTAGLANSQFISEGGGVGGEFGLVDLVTQLNGISRDLQNATVLLILTLFLLGLLTLLLLRHIKSHVPLRVQITKVPRGFRRRDKIRYHAIKFGRKFSEITEELKKVQTKEERRTTIINFAKKIFKLHDNEKSPTLAYDRLPESFFEPDEEDVSSLPEDLRLMISSIRVFGHLKKSYFIGFCKFIETVELNIGEYLFRIGDEDKYVYVIRSGRIQITVTEPDGSKFIIAEVGKGGSVDSLLSVLSILTGYPSTFKFMEAVALEPTTVLCLPAQSFLEICKPQTPALFRIIQMIAVRLQRLSFNALHTYLGLSSELINKEFSPISGSSESHEFLCKVFEKRPSVKDFNKFGHISLKYSDLDLACSKVKFATLNTINDQKFGNAESGLEQVFTYHDLNVNSMSQSGALELGESPIFYSQKKTSPIICSPSQPPSPNCERHSTNLRRAHSLADASCKPKFNYDDVNTVKKDNDNEANKQESDDFTEDVNFTKTELEEMIRFAEKDLANLLNLTDTSILHGHVSLITVSTNFILSRECEMQLEMYYVIFGELKAFQSTTDGSNVVTMFKCGPGKVVGLLGLITGEPNIYGIQATTKTIIAVLSRERFYSIVRQYPKALFSVTHIISSHLSPLFHQLDFAMEWLSIKSGKALYKKGDVANHVYVVLSGRLRQVDNMPDGGHRIVCELGRGDLVGFLEVISQQTRITTVMAIRDSELAQIPSHLLHYLKNKVPQVLTRIIQLLSDKLLGNLTTSSNMTSQLGMPILHITSTNALLTSGLGYTTDGSSKLDVLCSPLNNGVMTNLRTIAVLPATNDINAEAFTLELQHSMSSMGSSVRLTSDIVLKRLGSCAFDSVSQYRLSTWLSHQEDSHRIVFFVCDCQRVSVWNRICIRQADCILVLALHSSDPARPSPIEMALKNDPTKVAKVLVLMYPLDTDYPESGKTAVWLNARPWISQHYHIRCEPRVFIPRSKLNLISFYTKVFAREKPNPLSDFSRLARYLVGEAVGLVLGGGGARGCSHVGLIRAFQEAGIPIDLIGGTSIGAFMGALWADETRVAQFTQRARDFTNCFNSIWKKIKDFTYPAVSIFSGKELNRQLQSIFYDRQIEDFWLPFFCVTTDITNCKMRIHTQGSVWRYIRGAITYPPLDPPICDPYDGALLADGSFLNSVPADVMVCFGAKTIFASDVGSAVETELTNYGDHLSGWYLLYNRYFRFGSSVLRIPSLTEIQARLAYISCVRQLEYIKASGICLYLRPPIDKYLTLQFSAFDEIANVGYEYIKCMLNTWHEEGRLQNLIPGVKPHISSSNEPLIDSSSSAHFTPTHSLDSFTATTATTTTTTTTTAISWLTQSFSDQLTFIDLAECIAKTYKGVDSSGSDKYYTTDSTNVQNLSQIPDLDNKTTITATNATVSSGSSIIAVRKFPKSTHTIVSDSISRYIDNDHCLQSGFSSKTSPSNVKHHKEKQKHVFDFVKNNLSCKRRRRFLSDCYNASSNTVGTYSYHDVNRAPIQNNLITTDVYNNLRRFKSDYNLLQIYDNSQTRSVMTNSDFMSVNNPSAKSAHVNRYSMSSFKSLEDDGYLEDDESSTDSAHSPVTASDPELRHDVYPESINVEERGLRKRSSSTYRLPPYLLHTEVSKKKCDSPNSDNNAKNPSVIKGQQGNNDVITNHSSARHRTKHNLKRHHRSSLDRLRTDRDRVTAN